MFSEELNNVLDSYRTTFSGRRKTFGQKDFKIGGRKYQLNFWFNDPHYGCQLTLSTLYDEETYQICRMLEINFRPEDTRICFWRKYYPKGRFPGPSSGTLLKMMSESNIKEHMSWDLEMFEEFINNLKIFLIEQL